MSSKNKANVLVIGQSEIFSSDGILHDEVNWFEYEI